MTPITPAMSSSDRMNPDTAARQTAFAPQGVGHSLAGHHADVLALQDFAEAFLRALARRIVARLYFAVHTLIAEAMFDMCSVPLGQVLLSCILHTSNPFAVASLSTTLIFAAVYADIVFLVAFFHFFAPFIRAMCGARCLIELVHMLFDAYCTGEDTARSARHKPSVPRALLQEVKKAVGIDLFFLAMRSMTGGGDNVNQMLTPGQAFLCVVVGRITIGLLILLEYLLALPIIPTLLVLILRAL